MGVKQIILLKLGFIKPDPREINYQCDEPFVKLQMHKSEMTSFMVNLPQFGFSLETLFKIEIALSPERF